jgi:hypothetical protein
MITVDPQTHRFFVQSLDFPPPLGSVLVSVVAVASGGGSYVDRELRNQIGTVSSSVMGVFARPYTEQDRVCARIAFERQFGRLQERSDVYPAWVQVSWPQVGAK